MNEYGLDTDYFKENLGKMLDHIDNAKPEAMYNALIALANVAEFEAYSLKREYCKEIGADSVVGLDSCDDFKDWLLSKGKA